MSARLIDPSLIAARRDRLRHALLGAPFDTVLTLSGANFDYATGYRSVSATVHGISPLAALVRADELLVVGPVSDSAPGFDQGLVEGDFLAYGRFYFESDGGRAEASRLVEQNADYGSAIAAAVLRLGLGSARIGLDERACPAPLRAQLAELLPGVEFVDASDWLAGVRAVKLPGEVDLLERSARIVESAIIAGIEAAGVGVTEAEIAAVVSSRMVAENAEPRFVVVTSGPRSALADAYATGRALERGDLLRFDVGGMYEGYWSDLGRTAVVGEPTARQTAYYDAILAGEDAQFALAAPGVPAEELFDRAIQVVESTGGPAPYRRQHCGHGIGLEVYEAPIVRPSSPTLLEAGMTFCFETPYYELGWGGMMVEDTLVVTDHGIRLLTDRARGLTVIPA
ncbi:Xaa-Pro peptidase family protein [Homoserinibacter sp. GY 40078]|uniref:M24 family metallopeptidase n=1 Tax=Homoserinibacter sp. GY 40078 TaxID=2603275 RepID=UPI0011C9C38B|nr:Xaa-Pro peptidase family protein [Homoserinibacter sp. GY 40078]TXK16963.1 aminopeptidase P family protein [Homoserinibacter sp. GY 40078]